MASCYENVMTKKINLGTNKEKFTEASWLTENLASDFPQDFGYITLRHCDLFKLMRELPGNSFKLYLYLYSQEPGCTWALHRAAVCETTGLSEREYRTAVSKLVELGVIDFESCVLSGFTPCETKEVIESYDKEKAEKVELEPDVFAACERWKNSLGTGYDFEKFEEKEKVYKKVREEKEQFIGTKAEAERENELLVARAEACLSLGLDLDC